MSDALPVREYGDAGPIVILIHGGPGAPGSMAPLARMLAPEFRVLEPWQRPSGSEPLTVAKHVQDLLDLVDDRCPAAAPLLVGHSWGAMLGLAFAAAHPDRAAGVVLIGCGTFDTKSRATLLATLDGRMSEELRTALLDLVVTTPDPDARLRRTCELLLPIYAHDPTTLDLELGPCDARAYRESWDDMLVQQERGVFPAAFTAVTAPVLMLHGESDPHPGDLIRAALATMIPHLEYQQWRNCGHYPWLERSVQAEFATTLRDWLLARGGPAAPQC